jgi:hypothetical protein
MGNIFTSQPEKKKINNDYLYDLKKWEKSIKMNNYYKNKNTNNGPNHIKILNDWVKNIKMNNFIKYEETNNPPDYILNLRNLKIE